jgi:hypothetical protein
MYFEKHRVGQQRKGGANRRIKALEVSYLNDAIVPSRNGQQFVGFGKRAGKGLLDKYVNAGFHQLASDREVGNRRNRDGDSIDSCGQPFTDRAKCMCAELGSDRVGTSFVGIDDAYELHFQRWIALEVAIDTGVIAAERTASYDANA